MLGAAPRPTGISEFDRVVSGGLVPGSVTLVSGPPGIGKSTLALQAAAGLARSTDAPVLYVAAEESPAQVRRRADRLGLATDSRLLVDAATSPAAIADSVGRGEVAAVIVDSIQTIVDPEVASAAGSVAQVRTCAQHLARLARETATTVVLIGHVTKDGSVAGPRTLEHVVDSVLSFEGDSHGVLRLLRATKHRFGPTGELGIFTMESDGLRGVADAGGFFLDERHAPIVGSVAVPVTEGRRTLFAEVQALVQPHRTGSAGRVCNGVDRGRFDLVLAVLEGCTDIGGEVYCSVAGGLATREPAADLAIALAVVSATTGLAVDPATLVCGEVSLVGRIRRVPLLQQRLAEARRLGFTRAIVPQGSDDVAPAGLEVTRAASLREALEVAFGRSGRPGHHLATAASGPGRLRIVPPSA